MATITPKLTTLASGLRFPEGPVAMPDGSIVLVEIERRTLSRVTPDGQGAGRSPRSAAAPTARRWGRAGRSTSPTTAG